MTETQQNLFDADEATGKLQAVWKVKEQLRALLRTSSLADAAAAKEELRVLVEAAGRAETTKHYRTACRWWKEIEVLIVAGAGVPGVPARLPGVCRLPARGVKCGRTPNVVGGPRP